jgi:hypothetical protein
VLGPLEIALALAALLVGATGSFSPCGFSVVETIGPTGHTGGRRTTLAACATFSPGALLGGVLTFGSLAALGQLAHGAGGRLAYAAAAAIALLAAVLEVRGTRIVPQIRRQLPEHWRRVMPMPLAAALYGVLLGIGFTTFVLSFGVWALAGICFAVGDPELGALVGGCFGVGRAIPVVALAPLAGSSTGARATDLMAGDGTYLAVRRGDAAALVVTAVALALATGSAGAANEVAAGSTDPSTSAGQLAFERVGGPGVIRSGVDIELPGQDPAIGGRYVAVLRPGVVRLLDRGSLATLAEVEAPGADAVTVSDQWLVYRIGNDGGDALVARAISSLGTPGPAGTVASIAGPAQLSPPSLDGATLVYAVAGPGGSRIVRHQPGTGRYRVLVRTARGVLFNPSVSAELFAYVRSEFSRSRLFVRPLDGRGAGRSILSLRRGGGVLWSTALGSDSAFVTVLQPSATSPGARIVEVAVGGGRKKKGKRKRR